jgi:hypothetical protein
MLRDQCCAAADGAGGRILELVPEAQIGVIAVLAQCYDSTRKLRAKFEKVLTESVDVPNGPHTVSDLRHRWPRRWIHLQHKLLEKNQNGQMTSTSKSRKQHQRIEKTPRIKTPPTSSKKKMETKQSTRRKQ